MSEDKMKKDAACQDKDAEEIKDEIKTEEIRSDENAKDTADTKKADKKAAKKEKAEQKAETENAKEEQRGEDTAAYAALNDKYLRICAEYDNFRRRSQKEKESLYGDVKADTLLKFLPVYDNLVRALSAATEDEAYKKGVEMIMTQFNTTMEKLGVTRIESLGEKFDPAFHNAVMHVDDEEKGENEIVEVFQEGFKLGDKVIRFAMVKVAN